MPRLSDRMLAALKLIRQHGGLTNDELVTLTGLQIQSVCPVAHKLAEAGLIRDSGQRRSTRTGARKGVDAASVFWSFDLPKLCRDDHLSAMGEVIRARGIEVAIVDPLYLTLLDARTASQAGNVFAMGPALAPLTEIGQATGCTIILAHHFRKTGASDPDEPASLEQLSQAGVVEWVRQWMLLERRSPYQADGLHELYMRTGGSAGHAGLWALDVDEGVRTVDHQADWRRWDVDVRPVADVRAEAQQAKDDRKAVRNDEGRTDERDFGGCHLGGQAGVRRP